MKQWVLRMGSLGAVLWLVLTVGEVLAGPAILLDHVGGEVEPGMISSQGTVAFYLRLQNDNPWGVPLIGAVNGFKIYSPDGASWQPVTGAEVIDMGQYFDLLHMIGLWSADGQGVDTVYISLARATLPGLPYGFDDVTHVFTTAVFAADSGRTLCLDSIKYFPPAGYWLWTYGSQYGSLRPTWGGPYCFEITTTDCCLRRGNIDHDPLQQIIINDLLYLVAFMFNQGPQPPCWSEANVDADFYGLVNVADLMYLVTYMFNAGPEPAPCG